MCAKTNLPSSSFSSSSPTTQQRVILHFDLDTFYTQVERNRLGIENDVDIPIAVQQWEGLIAVNYAGEKMIFSITVLITSMSISIVRDKEVQ